MKKDKTPVGWVSAALVLVYLVTYLFNSIAGGYWPTPVLGRHSYKDSGLGMPTLFLWQPAAGYSDSMHSDLLGTLYFPLIRLDRGVWHHDLDLLDPEDEELIFSTNGQPDAVRWHPRGSNAP